MAKPPAAFNTLPTSERAAGLEQAARLKEKNPASDPGGRVCRSAERKHT